MGLTCPSAPVPGHLGTDRQRSWSQRKGFPRQHPGPRWQTPLRNQSEPGQGCAKPQIPFCSLKKLGGQCCVSTQQVRPWSVARVDP